MSVRICATDWVEGGFDGDDAVAFARLLVERGLRHRRRLHRPGLARPAAGLRAQLPDAVRRPDPPRGGHPGDRGRRDLQLRRRQHDHPRRPRRPLRARPPAPVGPALDPARRRRPGRRHGMGAAVPLRLARAEHRQGRAPHAAAPLRRGATHEDRRRHRRQARDRRRDRRALRGAATAWSRSPAPTSTSPTRTRWRACSGRSAPVDVLVNNAGVSSSAPLERTTLEDWHAQIDVNATGAFLCTRAVLDGMRERDARPDRHRRLAREPRRLEVHVRLHGLQARGARADARGRRRGRRHRRDRQRRLPGLRAQRHDRRVRSRTSRRARAATARRRWPRWRRSGG